MLTHLHLRDFVLVDRLEVEFQPGFTVLTGETGAGKSILVEALGLVLGNRADSAMVRHGARRAEIVAGVDLAANPEARAWLEAHELDDDEECQLRRTLGADGRSRAYINGRPVPRQQLLALGALLVDIHGQHEHQSLLRRDFQLHLLDAYADHPRLLTTVAEHYRQLRKREDELQELERLEEEAGGQLDLLRYQLEELQTLALDAGGLRDLEEEHRRLANADALLATGQHGLALLEDDDRAVEPALARLESQLRELQDPQLAEVCELLEGAGIQVREAAAELRRYCEGLTPDPARLQEVERRLGTIHDLARKHRVRADQLPALTTDLARRCERLEGAAQRRTALQEEIAAALEAYEKACATLSASRRRAAKALGEEISSRMSRLGMPGGRVEIQVEALPPERRSLQGLDRVEFLVAANPGQPPRPLARTASGGELSRISLAIHVTTARRGGIPTLIFDEVDVGVGGRIAEIVGQELKTLGEQRQVLCITHLPQVAAQGHHHLKVSKVRKGGATTTRIQPLHSPEQRREEIARMLGGTRITARTRAHAQEMIEGMEGD
ncbi:MAG TPA: DNA repair protein RecN [Gammaproteobacteria bacterium]|nr:DNA repair protein RecN [Gammaproteobacteria bacterium]